MRALIIQKNPDLGNIWRRHLERLEIEVTVAQDGNAARDHILKASFDVILLDLVLAEGSAFAITDLVRFRQPNANIVVVTDTTFFSDGSIFQHAANARALVKTATPPEDLAAIVYHYGKANLAHGGHQSPTLG